VSADPARSPLAFLVGTWEGEGWGSYPTIEPFGYRETVVFSETPKPFLAYSQRTFALDDGRPLHVETGYWRWPAPGRVELVLAHPTGIAEVQAGRVDGTCIALGTTGIGLTPTAKPVTALSRVVAVAGDTMRYRLSMAAVGEDLTHHLAATLTRKD
jgi:hypothetical protein